MVTRRALDLVERNWPEAMNAQSVCILLAHRLSGRLQENARLALKPLGLTLTEFELLLALRSVPAPHERLPSDLYDAMLITSGGMTKVLRAMEAEGLIERPEHDGDRRRRPIRLTEAGRERAELAMTTVQAADQRMLTAAGFEAEDYERLRSELLPLVDCVDAAPTR